MINVIKCIPELVYIEHTLFQVQLGDYESRYKNNLLRVCLISVLDTNVLFLPFPRKQSLPHVGIPSQPIFKLCNNFGLTYMFHTNKQNCAK